MKRKDSFQVFFQNDILQREAFRIDPKPAPKREASSSSKRLEYKYVIKGPNGVRYLALNRAPYLEDHFGGLGYVVNNHGDRFCPLSRVVGPLTNGLNDLNGL